VMIRRVANITLCVNGRFERVNAALSVWSCLHKGTLKPVNASKAITENQ
jgi:hypothetical protein